MSKISYEARGSGILEKTSTYINSWFGLFLFSGITLFYTIMFILVCLDSWSGDNWYDITLMIGIFIYPVSIGFICGIDKIAPLKLSQYNYDKYRIYNFDINYINNIIYKKAFDDCVEEIKNGDFVTDAWEKIFKDLNVELYEIEQQEKKKKIAIDRLDYAKVLKDANKLYLGE